MTAADLVWFLLALHGLGIATAAVLGSRVRPPVTFAIAGLAPAITAVWAIVVLADRSRTPSDAEVTWVEGLDLSLRFRVDELSLVMTVLVSGIGALVFLYASGYFSAGAAAIGRFASSLLAFSASMLGLVLADSIWTLFMIHTLRRA